MKVLLVTPVQEGSGETITSLHIAESLTAAGEEVRFLASPFARRFIDQHFPGRVWELGLEASGNRRLWDAVLAEFRPEVVVFADYSLLFFPSGCVPLASAPGWIESLDSLDASLVTLDHFGFAQREEGLYMGPPHFGFHYYQRFPPLPPRMHVLLPCPMHEPGTVEGRRGEPFRYWEVPLGVSEAERREVRQRFLTPGREFLVFHSVPNWAWQPAEALGLPFYRFLPEILDAYLGDLPVTVVSVNNGRLLAPPASGRLPIVNLGPIPRPQFEALLFGSDLVLTENKLSISMGKAVCGLQPCAVLRNGSRLLALLERLQGRLRELVLAMENVRPGAIYRYEVFPTVVPEDLEAIGLYRGNSLAEAFGELEVYGGEETREALHRLLTDAGERERLCERQQVYVDRLRALPESAQLLRALVEQERGAR